MRRLVPSLADSSHDWANTLPCMRETIRRWCAAQSNETADRLAAKLKKKQEEEAAKRAADASQAAKRKADDAAAAAAAAAARAFLLPEASFAGCAILVSSTRTQHAWPAAPSSACSSIMGAFKGLPYRLDEQTT